MFLGLKKKITCTDFLFHCHKHVQYEYVIRMCQALIKVWTVIRTCLMTNNDVINLPVSHMEARGYLGRKLPSALAQCVVTSF